VRPCRAFAFCLVLAGGLGASYRALAEQPVFSPKSVDLSRLTLGAHSVVTRTASGSVAELTLAPKLEEVAKRLLSRARPVEGAIVALDIASGDVLAWAETRSGVITEARAPAASVFKLVTTSALFENTSTQPSDTVCISGGERGVERRHLERPPAREASCRPFSEALGYSRNAAFAQLVTKNLLRADLISIADRLGFNHPVPFDFPATVGTLEVPYNDLEFARAATGFRGSTLSPLGAAYIATAIARGGTPIRLRLVRRTDDYEAPKGPEELPRMLSATTAWRLSRMMEVTVHSGTARGAFTDPEGQSYLPGVRVAGKTGTLRPLSGTTTTSWFVGFAPSRKPEVAVSVLLNNGEVWHNRAAEVARDVLRAYFRGRGLPRITDPLAPAPAPEAQPVSSLR